ncbi:MAG: GTPase/DUF3482 domain-containing protein [Gammaproteobacteria bacterium]
MSPPVFAVVGHPNKGKSSIVSTLACDDSVQVAPTPGTTVTCRRFPMRVDGETLYILIDTPGFQRARRVLAWMKQSEGDASKRLEVVRQFVTAHRYSGQFSDECELLTPLLEGAGILYVIDGSTPYGGEYEAEMEILRWTGQPSMALINLIGSGDHIEDWKAALGQYFKIVRVFNALTAEFDKRLELLRAFGQLKEEWREPLGKAVASLEADRANRRVQSARAIAEMLVDMLALKVSKRLASEGDAKAYETQLMNQYRDKLRMREQQCRDAVQAIYDYHSLQREEPAYKLVDQDLFSEHTWSFWGLSTTQLLATGAVSGALLGTGADVALGGASLMAGAVLGSVIGGTSAWFSAKRIAHVRLFGIPLGGKEARVGPSRNPNFPYVVLGRALFHHACVVSRTHARRDALKLGEMAELTSTKAIPNELRRRLERCFAHARRSAGSEKAFRLVDELTDAANAAIGEHGLA